MQENLCSQDRADVDRDHGAFRDVGAWDAPEASHIPLQKSNFFCHELMERHE